MRAKNLSSCRCGAEHVLIPFPCSWLLLNQLALASIFKGFLKDADKFGGILINNLTSLIISYSLTGVYHPSDHLLVKSGHPGVLWHSSSFLLAPITNQNHTESYFLLF
jgi:hypothetical protein